MRERRRASNTTPLPRSRWSVDRDFALERPLSRRKNYTSTAVADLACHHELGAFRRGDIEQRELRRRAERQRGDVRTNGGVDGGGDGSG